MTRETRNNVQVVGDQRRDEAKAISRRVIPSVLRVALTAASALAVLLAAPPARADLSSDAERVVKMWSARGARVTRLPPVFLELGRVRSISLSPPGSGAKDPSKDSAADKASPGCLTAVLLAPRTSELLVDPSETPRDADPLEQLMHRSLPRSHPPVGDAPQDRRLRSAAGALAIARCGASRHELTRLLVELKSPRSAVEVIVAESREELGDLKGYLARARRGSDRAARRSREAIGARAAA